MFTCISEFDGFGNTGGPEAQKWAEKRDEIYYKYNYITKLSPMQNAYLEMTSRFYEQYQYPSIASKYFGTTYPSAKKALDQYTKCMNSSRNEFICIDHLRQLRFYELDEELRSQPSWCKINETDDFVSKHAIEINKLETVCPEYYLQSNDPYKNETCYLASLEYWKFMATYQINQNSGSIFNDFHNNQRSYILRKYYFNTDSFPYPKYRNII